MTIDCPTSKVSSVVVPVLSIATSNHFFKKCALPVKCCMSIVRNVWYLAIKQLVTVGLPQGFARRSRQAAPSPCKPFTSKASRGAAARTPDHISHFTFRMCCTAAQDALVIIAKQQTNSPRHHACRQAPDTQWEAAGHTDASRNPTASEPGQRRTETSCSHTTCLPWQGHHLHRAAYAAAAADHKTPAPDPSLHQRHTAPSSPARTWGAGKGR